MKKVTSVSFVPILGLLIFVLVVAGGIAAYAAYSSRNNEAANVTQQSQDQQTIQKETIDDGANLETPQADAETEGWTKFEATGYSIRLADGWKIMKKEGSADSFFTTENGYLKFTPGQKAVLQEYAPDGPSEFVYGLYIDYSENLPSDCSGIEDMKASFKTEGGNVVYKSEASGAGSNRVEGDKTYFYCVQLSDASTLKVAYFLNSSLEDHHVTVERVVKTVHTK